MPEYVTAEDLGALVGPAAAATRVQLAVDAANALIPTWCPQKATGDPPVAPDPPVNPITQQAALELAHELFRAHAAVGGIFNVDELLGRLPADRVRPIRDLLDAVTGVWGLA